MTEVASLCRVLRDNVEELAQLIALDAISLEEAKAKADRCVLAVLRAAEQLRLQAERVASAKKKAP